MSDMLHIASLQLAGVLAIMVVLIAGAIGVALKGQAAWSLSPVVAGFVSMPVAVVAGVGTVIALTVDPTVAAAAIVTVLVALTASTIAVLTKIGDNKKAAREDAAALTIELAKISRSVDGVATKQVDKVASLEETITQLRAQLAEEKSTASTLAATHAAVSVVAAVGHPATEPSLTTSAPAASLEKIDKNTAETATNTARVKADVQDLKDQQP